MLFQRTVGALVVLILSVVGANLHTVEGLPRRILLDTDVNTDDLFALVYLLKLNRSEFNLEAVTISANAWINAGHAVNHIYDILYMMDRDDIAVGVGGEGGIQDDGTILPDVGGYYPIIEQGLTTVGECRYRQAIPKGSGGRLDLDTNYGIRKEFLPQGKRKYSPFQQPTAQQVLIEKASAGPITIFMIGTLTNVGIFLMSHPHLKKNVEHIYIMGGGVRSKNPVGCCAANSTSACSSASPGQCAYPGNLFTVYNSNPYAEFNFFADPFAAYQVIHSGIPITLVPLDATNTIPITNEFFTAFERRQDTYEAQYIFKSLKITRDTWFDDKFYERYYMWDSFMVGVAVSIMSNPQNLDGANEFAEMEHMNVTVITSNAPYGISDGSNPFFDSRKVPKFNLTKGGVHSGHVQMGLQDSFCIVEKGKCKDGYTAEVDGAEAVRVLVATKAKPNRDITSPLDREYFVNFLDVLNRPQHAGRFNFTTQSPCRKEEFYKPDFGAKQLGKPVIFDMDMSAGDFLALFYLLKVPVEKIDLKAIIVTPTGWANAATIDILYDILHMMGRDDILVGLGDVYAINQTDPLNPVVGQCKYIKAIPEGSGGLLDSDTLYGIARDLPRSPRRYTAENSAKYGAPRDTAHPELRQPLAHEVWDNVTRSLPPESKITILTTGPLTSLAKIISSAKCKISLIQDVYIVGGHISHSGKHKGNVFTIPSNEYAEFNMFLDPQAAKTVFESELDITLIPLAAQRRISSFSKMLHMLHQADATPEAKFALHLLSTLDHLKQNHSQYHHMDTFLGEILGAVFLAGNHSHLHPTMRTKSIKVIAEGGESKDGWIIPDKRGKSIKVLKKVNSMAYYKMFANQLGDPEQSAAVTGSCTEPRNGMNS